MDTKDFEYKDELTHEIKRAPFYSGDGNLSVNSLQTLCKEYKEYCYQINIQYHQIKKDLEDTKLRESYNLDVANDYGRDIDRLEKELYQQRFNNKHNLSIDQAVSDEIFKLRWQNKEMRLGLEKIEDPRKIGHTERDEITQNYCFQNIAHVTLRKIDSLGSYGVYKDFHGEAFGAL